ncbi:calcium-binding protein CP1 [Punica granatum]|uniref:EF-hand domain-containing protein n=2 Tax=Punica granatum TaxID=22663 RepID=A0A218XS88_PUNGR|nr:calcium-binding protein CP1 [Punica granatum]OWM88045.1 hypothetical protein CDL15_Pgr016618 [Punica granatum]PKI48079.1 hypothetical protein CRG98_031523 [Punica granatum]
MCPSGRSLPTKRSADDLRPAFEVLDADRDGKISPDDLRTFYAGNPGAAGGEDDLIGTMISVADANQDGFVEYEEFELVLDGVRESSKASRDKVNGVGSVMEDAFRVMDRDGDGRLSREDLRSFMELAGLGASDDEITAMMRLGGGDEAGGVTYEGFIKILAFDDIF